MEQNKGGGVSCDHCAGLNSEGLLAVCRIYENPCTRRGLLTWRARCQGVLRLFAECFFKISASTNTSNDGPGRRKAWGHVII